MTEIALLIFMSLQIVMNMWLDYRIDKIEKEGR